MFGTHNPGTGQSEGSAVCAFRNQQHDVGTQLELGMLDVDTIYTKKIKGCSTVSLNAQKYTLGGGVVMG